MISNNNPATLIDENDTVVGYKSKLDAHRWPAPLHRAVSVVVFNGNKILLQKRSSKKPVWPLFWTNTCCGNVLKGENYEQCAKRRLLQEMGIKIPIREVFYFKYKRRYNKEFGEHELDHIFVGEYSGTITLNPDEAAGCEWVTKEHLQKDIKNNPGKYTPWFKIIMKKLKT